MKKFLVFIGLIIIVIVLMLSYYGLFTEVKIVEREVGPLWLVYEKHIGDYKNVGPVMDIIYNDLLSNASIEAAKGFGLYYDNPQEIEKEKLRSIVGCILEKGDENKIEDLKDKYKIKEYPSSKSVVVEFPFKGMLSIFIGIFKVYPKLSEYIKNHSYSQAPIMEIYDRTNKKITYVASVKLDPGIFDNFLE